MGTKYIIPYIRQQEPELAPRSTRLENFIPQAQGFGHVQQPADRLGELERLGRGFHLTPAVDEERIPKIGPQPGHGLADAGVRRTQRIWRPTVAPDSAAAHYR
jgi:hypothetical protein